MRLNERRKDDSYQSFFINAVEGQFQSTPEGRFMIVNPALAKMCGYSSPEEMVDSITDIARQYYVDAEDRKTFKNTIDADGFISDFEHATRRKDGSILWASTSARAVRDDQGNLLFYEGVHVDITRRKQAESALKESEEHYRSLFENATEAIFVAQDGRIALLNPAMTSVVGYAADEVDELKLKPFAEFIHPEDQGMVIDRHFRRLNGEEFPGSYSFRILHKDKSIRWVELSTVLIAWNNKPGTLNFMSDITQAKQAEETLAESEEKFRHIFESANDAFLVMDQTVISDCNARAMEMFCCTREQIIGLTPCCLSPDYQPDGKESVPAITSYVAKAYDGQRQMFNWQFFRGDDGLFFAEVSLNSFISARRRYVLAVLRDITDIRKQWEEYKNLYNNLQDMSAMVAERVERMNRIGAEKMEEFKESMGKALGIMKRRRLNVGGRQAQLDDNRQTDDTAGNDPGAVRPAC